MGAFRDDLGMSEIDFVLPQLLAAVGIGIAVHFGELRSDDPISIAWVALAAFAGFAVGAVAMVLLEAWGGSKAA